MESIERYAKSLREVSMNFNDEYCLSSSNLRVISCDDLCKCFCKKNKIPTMRSVDAMWVGDDEVLLIEFKDSRIESNDACKNCIEAETCSNRKANPRKLDSREKEKVWRKAYESIIMLEMLSECHMRTIKDRVKYILVYRDEKNHYSQKIGNHVSRMAGEEIIRFGLGRLNCVYKEVHTYTQQEFAEWQKFNMTSDSRFDFYPLENSNV